MNKEEFLKQLEIQLSGMPENEKQEALQYYRDYFEDAGEDKEEEILKSLGTPAEVARSIREENGAGEYTENGYREETKGGAYMAQSALSNPQGTAGTGGTDALGQGEKKKMDTATIVLIVVIAVLTFPIWFAALSGVAGTIIGLIGTLVGIGVAGPVLVISCIAIVIGSFAALAAGLPGPIVLMTIGAGLVVGAIGVLFILIAVTGCYYFIPWIIGVIKKLWNKLFPKKEAA